MTTTSNDQPLIRRRTRHPALPEVEQIEALISQARSLRLKLVELLAHEMLTEPAKGGVEALSKAGQELERIIELVTSAKTRRRKNP
jgi:hypothetical protein